MNENFGIKNEKEIIKTINGKFLDELPEHFRTPIYAMYRYHHEVESSVSHHRLLSIF